MMPSGEAVPVLIAPSNVVVAVPPATKVTVLAEGWAMIEVMARGWTY